MRDKGTKELELLPQNVSGVILRKVNPWPGCGKKFLARVATLQHGSQEGQAVTGRKPGKDLVTANQRPFNNGRWALGGRSIAEKSNVGAKADGENHPRAVCQDCANSGTAVHDGVATHHSVAGRRETGGQSIVFTFQAHITRRSRRSLRSLGQSNPALLRIIAPVRPAP